MAILFNTIPDDVLAPFFGVEFKSSGNNYPATGFGLLIGQKLSTGTATTDAVVIVGNKEEDGLFGRGSMLASMVKKFKKNNPTATPYVLALADPSGTKATATIAVTTATATVSETIKIEIAGRTINVAVVSGQSQATIASNIATAINANLDIPVVAVYTSGASLAVNSRHNGTAFNGLRIKKIGTPTLVFTVANLASGTGDVDLTGKEVNIPENIYFNYFAVPYSDDTNIGWVNDVFSNVNGRWSYLSDAYGHAFSIYSDSLSNTTSNALENDEHLTVLSLPATTQRTPLYEILAGAVGQAVLHLTTPPELSRPLGTIVIDDCLVDTVFDFEDRNALYAFGYSPFKFNSSNELTFDRVITTYLKDGQNVADDTYKDINTMAQLMYMSRYYRNRMQASFPREYINGTTLDRVQAVFASILRELEELDVIRNVEEAITQAVIEINATNPRRIDVRFEPTHVMPLLQTATQIESKI